MSKVGRNALSVLVGVLIFSSVSVGQDPAATPATAPVPGAAPVIATPPEPAPSPAPVKVEEAPPPVQPVTAPPTTPPAAPAAPTTATPEKSAALEPAKPHRTEMSVWDMIKTGGVILWVLMALSVVTMIMAIYYITSITPRREVPENFVRRAQAQIKAGDLRGAFQMCEERDEIVAKVLRAGLKMHGHDRYVIQEAMESEGERSAAGLWQQISYLNNIGHIAPLLGLMGTVWGMIGAFGTIASDDSSGAKSIMMALNVAKAMINTLVGLTLAVFAMSVYFYLRGRVVRIVSEVETNATEFIEALSRTPKA